MMVDTLIETRRFCPEYDSWTTAILEVNEQATGDAHMIIERWNCKACDGTHEQIVRRCTSCGTALAA